MITRFVDNIANTRHGPGDVATIEDAVTKYGGDAGDYVQGDHPIGSIRDPDTGHISYTPPPKSEESEMAGDRKENDAIIEEIAALQGALEATLERLQKLETGE